VIATMTNASARLARTESAKQEIVARLGLGALEDLTPPVEVRERRLPIVKLLLETGHSQRAIADVLGVTKGVIQYDLDWLRQQETSSIEVGRLERRGLRIDKDSSFTPTTTRSTQLARAQLQRLSDGLSEVSGLCRGLRDVDLGMAASSCEADELKAWETKAGELARSLRSLQTRIKEVGNEKA